MSMSRDARMRSAQSRRSVPLPRATNNILNDSPTCASQPRPNGPRTGRSALTQPEALAPPRTTSHLSERGGDRRREEASSVRIPLAHLRHERLSEHILLLVGLGTARLVEAVDDALRLAKVDRLQRVAHPVLHLLHHAAHVGHVRRHVPHRQLLLLLPRQRSGQVHLPLMDSDRVASLNPQHDGRGELVRSSLRPERPHLYHVYGVPIPGLQLLLLLRVLLDQHARREGRLVEVPKVDRGDAPLVVHLAVALEDVVRQRLHRAQLWRRQHAVRERRVILVCPRGPVRVAVAIVVA
mmetsp:Transcript_50975/g.163703  ORF Transcript_50975/g.163703 Transcript_50975/m.163703 type:complete len:295 (-) Transcript_50975:230-1114(-)